jgi:hypothetical protein
MSDDPQLADAAAIADGRPTSTRATSEGIRLIDRIARVFGAPVRESKREHRASLFLWGPLEVRRSLGAGSFGEVFAAWDPTLQREVALKLRGPETGALRWLDEARNLARIRHSHVLTVHGADVLDGRAGIWTELIAGRTLEQEIETSGPFSESEVLRIGRDIASALVAVHEAGLVHGDIKTGNIMLEEGASQRRAVLVDFGSADAMLGIDDIPAYVVGTPLTMAPEVLEGKPATGASDVYGLGATLFRMLTRRYPIECETIDELQRMHASGERRSVRAFAPHASPRIARVLDRALECDSAQRWPNARAFLRALEDAADPTRRIRARATAIGAGAAALAAIIVLAILIARPGPGPISRAALAAPRAPGILGGNWQHASDQSQSNWGQTMTTLDLDGDGFTDLVAGQSLWIGADSLARGRIVVFRGSPDGPSMTPETIVVGDVAGMAYGHRVTDAGDVDADGFHDLLVIDVPYGGDLRPGHVFLYRGGPRGRPPSVAWSITGQSRESGLGTAMTSAGDVNGDGYDDVVIGEGVATDRFDREGIVRVFLGSPSGLGPTPAWTARGGQAVAQLGAGMHTAGDVNGDGYDDVLVGAAVWDGAAMNCGQARLYLGGANGVVDAPAWTIEGAGTNSQLGTTVAGAGDVNGDGYADVVIGEPQYSDEGRPERGRVLLFLGARAGLSSMPDWQALGAVAYMHFGYTVCGVGDIDGDGLDDVGVSAPQYTEGKRVHLGAVEVYRGTHDGCESSAAWRAIGSAPDEHLGFSLSSGDFNGDHMPDLVIGAPFYGDTIRERGLLLAYLGQRPPK